MRKKDETKLVGNIQMFVSFYLVEEWPLSGLDVFRELLLELCDFGGVHLVEEASDTTVDDGDLFLDGHGHILSLLKQLSQPNTTVQQLLSGCVQI